MGKISWFCSWRAQLHPRGERCRLCQLSRHKEHTWSGITCPGLCPQPVQSPGQEQSEHPAPGCPQESNTQRPQGSNPCWLHSAPPPAQGQQRFGSCSLRSCCRALEEQSSSSSAEPEPPHSGAIAWETNVPSVDRKRSWSNQVITDTRYDAAGLGQSQAAPGSHRGLQEQRQSQSWHLPALTQTQTLQLPSSNVSPEPSEPSQSCSGTATEQSRAAATGKRL